MPLQRYPLTQTYRGTVFGVIYGVCIVNMEWQVVIQGRIYEDGYTKKLVCEATSAVS